jgi:hypothetical protein
MAAGQQFPEAGGRRQQQTTDEAVRIRSSGQAAGSPEVGSPASRRIWSFERSGRPQVLMQVIPLLIWP